MKKNMLGYLLLAISLITASTQSYQQHLPLYLYTHDSDHAKTVFNAFKDFNVTYTLEDFRYTKSNGLHILFDAHLLEKKELPTHYIVYQTLDLKNTPLTTEYLSILAGAIAVWDYDRENIEVYRDKIYNYYYFPNNYENTDPVILPVFLTQEAIPAYKNLLVYSNKDNTEISSLIPCLFFHSYFKKPKLIIEAGVCLGYSTQAFKAINELHNSHLLGLDNDPNAIPAYNGIDTATFLLINDTNFAHYYTQSAYKDTPLDIVFIDTSHQYHHTLAEINHFMPLLAEDGMFMFHDSNVTPLTIQGSPAFWRINNTIQLACVNPKGVAPAIKDYWGIEFDESTYVNTTFVKDGRTWHFVHYPFCNGLAVLKRIK